MKKKFLAILSALSIASAMGTAQAADTYEQHYLANGDFDSGLSHWGQTWQSGKGTMTVVKYEGDNVVHMKTDNGRCYISQSIQNITEGDRLTLSFRQKVVSLAPGAMASITLSFRDKAGQYITQHNNASYIVDPDKWEYRGIDFIVPPGTGSMSLLMRLYNGGEVYYDDIDITDFENETHLTVTNKQMELHTLPDGLDEVTANLHYVPEYVGESGSIVFAAYEDSKLVGMEIKPFTANKSVYSKATLKIPENSKNLSVKAYVWKNGQTSTPIVKSVELPKKERSEVFDIFVKDKMRGVYDGVSLFYDTQRQKMLEDLGMNTFIYNIIGNFKSGDINKSPQALDEVCEDMEKYVDETGIRIFMKASYGANSVVGNTQFGEYHPGKENSLDLPCPLSEEYWEKEMMSRLEVVAKHPKIVGVVFDMEMYSGGSTSYPGKCLCDKCVDKYYSEHKDDLAIKLSNTDINERAEFLLENDLYDKYNEWFEEKVAEVTAIMRKKLHAINPDLIIGVMPQTNWPAGISKGLGTKEMPLVIFEERTYKGITGIKDTTESLAQLNDDPIIFAVGLWPNQDSAIKVNDFAAKIKEAYQKDLGYWIYSGAELEKEPKYYTAIEKAHKDILNK